MDEYISRVTLIVNGEEIEDFSAFEEDERELKKTVKLMNKTGVLAVKPRYGFSLDYVVPKSGAFDFADVEDGTASVEFENGDRVTFGGVECLKIGKAKYDGDKETTKTIDFAAATRSEE